MSSLIHAYIEREAYSLYLQKPTLRSDQHWHQAEENLKIFPSTPFSLAGYAGSVRAYGLVRKCGEAIWISCRESFENKWHRYKSEYCTKRIGFSCESPNQVANFLRDIEIDCLRLPELTKFQYVRMAYSGTYNMWLAPAPFWYGDPCRISFLTLFLRLMTKADNLHALWSVLPQFAKGYERAKPSFEAFLSGRTKFNGAWNPDNSNHYWMAVFTDKTKDEVEKLLV